MSQTNTARSAAEPKPTSDGSSTGHAPNAVSFQPSPSKLHLILVSRIHFYAGLFVGPFIFVVALSGLLYALTPQLEQKLYAEQLSTVSTGPSLSLARQVEIAQMHVGEGASLWAVRPAHAAGATTRVMFSQTGLDASEHRGIFVDPVEGTVRGDLRVYGTSGVTPLRKWIGDLHRRLFLGEAGRIYSELAASWLWIIALGGLVVWLSRRGRCSRVAPGTRSLRSWHSLLGLWMLIAMLFFSATGLTWSKWAGSNIGIARGAWGMATPALSTALDDHPAAASGEHDHHQSAAPSQASLTLSPELFDAVYDRARSAGIDATRIEIRPAQATGLAWTVSEIDRSWPTQVDAVAVHPQTLKVVDQIEFENFPLAAKLTRWGIDAHMGVLFGVANQVLLIVAAMGVLAMVCMGYLMWWRRRSRLFQEHYLGSVYIWSRLPLLHKAASCFVLLTLGYAMPVFGVSLLGFLLLDTLVSVSKGSGSPTKKPRDAGLL